METVYINAFGDAGAEFTEGPFGLFSQATRVGVNVLVVYPGGRDGAAITCPKKTVVVLDDGDLTLKSLNIAEGGPKAFDADPVKRIVREASHVVVNADTLSRKVILAVTMAAKFDGPCVLIETCDYFPQWAKFVITQRSGGSGVLLSGPLDDLPNDIKALIKNARNL
jgi:hypothetical protein